MPTYVYRCVDCGREIELEQSITDDFRPTCLCDPDSNDVKENMERVIQPSCFILKGSGWAKDGYK